jgi:peptidoglycan/xylan/chitin deacetylase (PgdA/CDA1 family)
MQFGHTTHILTIRMPKPEFDINEKPPLYARVGLYLPLLVIIGLSITILAFVASMKVLGWEVPSFFGGDSTLSAFSKHNTKNADIAIYTSSNTDRYFSQIGGNYQRLTNPWRGYFQDRKLDVAELSSVDALRNFDGGVIILPSAVALSDEEKSALLKFQSDGGSLLATWATGTRDQRGVWLGWDFLDKLGAKSWGEMSADSDAHYLVLDGESPLSYTHAAGMRIWMGKTAEHPLLLSGEKLAGRVMDWARIPVIEQAGQGAIVYSNGAANAGRCAVYAFAESSWESQPQPLYTLVDDTLNWLTHRPNIVRSAWPNGKRAAEVIEMDTEDGFPNALRFASMMSSVGYKGSFFILTSVAKLYPDVLFTLAKDFDLGYHGDIHISFKDQPEALQAQRMDTMIADMKTLLPDHAPLTGFRAPTEGYDKITEKLLQNRGVRYHVADPNSTEARLPFFDKIEGVDNADTIVVLPRTQRDDINLSKQEISVDQTAQALIEDLRYTLDMGALGLLSVHSQNYGDRANLTQAMPTFLTELKKHRDKLWLASSTQVAQWWRERDRFKVSSQLVGKRLEFDVTIQGDRPLEGASLTLMLPQKAMKANIQGIKTGMPEVKIERIDDYRLSIQFGKLEPGNYAYQATFE